MVDNNMFFYAFVENLKLALPDLSLCKRTNNFIEIVKEEYEKIKPHEKIEYGSYSLIIIKKLHDNYGLTKSISISDDIAEDEIILRFCMTFERGFDGKKIEVTFDYRDIEIYDVQPKRLPIICGYQKGDSVTTIYNKKYKEINDNAYNEIGTYGKYIVIPKNVKDEHVYEPIVDLVVETLNTHKKCAPKLYQSIFKEDARIILKLFRRKYAIYDFSTKPVPEIPTSLEAKKMCDDRLEVAFNNNRTFEFRLNTNATEIKEMLSLKFDVNIIDKQIEKYYNIASGTLP